MKPLTLPSMLALMAGSWLVSSADATAMPEQNNKSRVWTEADSYLGEPSDAPPSTSLPEPPAEVDVVIVGGGFSGLMSAYELQKAGLKTVVLEAKSAIGGRSRSSRRQSGKGIIELGATWINNKTQPVVYGLTQEFGLDLAEQYTNGDFVFQGPNGRVLRLPPDSLVNTDDPIDAVLEGNLTTLFIEAEQQIDIRDFDKFPLEEDVSFEDWIALKGLGENEHVRAISRQMTAAMVGREPSEVGAHYFLDYVKSGNGLISLSTEGADGAQSLKVKQGTTAIAVGLAKALTPGSILINTPVESITQGNGTTSVTAGTGQTFKSRRVIIAIPTNTYADITFTPPLPCHKAQLTSSTKPGVYAKLILSYASPWWREAGLVGKFTSSVGPVSFSWDTSDLAHEQYSLAIFVAGGIAARWHELSDQDKETGILEHLGELVGEDLAHHARDVLEINYVEWTLEDYLFGAPTSSIGPGMLRKYGEVLREPFGSLHFGGAEMAYEWKGYLEGALTAGQNAAEEAITALEGAFEEE